jgi:hypothetical protein
MKAKGKLDNNAIRKLQINGNMVCEKCRGTINLNQYIYIVNENFYHDCCSHEMKGRVRIL